MKAFLPCSLFLLSSLLPAALSWGKDSFLEHETMSLSREEKKDIQYFQYGKIISIGTKVGYRVFTQKLFKHIRPQVNVGGSFNYYFDFRFALHISAEFTESNVEFPGFRTYNDVEEEYINADLIGRVQYILAMADIKYYLNEDLFRKAVAQFNPYIMLGLSKFFIAHKLIPKGSSSEDPDFFSETTQSSPLGFNAGFGIEIPVFRKSFHMGFQFLYHFVNFPLLETVQLIEYDDGDFLTGDIVTANITLSVSF